MNGQEKVERCRWWLSRNAMVDITLTTTSTKITLDELEILRKYVDLLKEALGDDATGDLEEGSVAHG